jgi:UDP-N-acetylglucosamine 2-epimerase (non-hydrolysing)
VSSHQVAVVLGTRPEMVKLAPLLRLLGTEASLVHTGQHYDESMSGAFLSALALPPPDLRLDVGGLDRGAQIAVALQAMEHHFRSHPPAVVVVQGDTNAALAGALAANACNIPLVHVEAGLRSHDRAMPEEHNRVLVDHLADLRCAPTPGNVANLQREGITDGVECTGNTVVEAVQAGLPDERDRAAMIARHGLQADGYVLATVHRPENTDDPAQLRAILVALGSLPLPTVLPLHPRTSAAVKRHGLTDLLGNLCVIDPVGHDEFLGLAAHGALLVSDSGGIQEECTVLKRPLVVVRRSTERPESFPALASLVQPDGIVPAAMEVLDDLRARLHELAALPSPYGDGSASQRIATAIKRLRHVSDVRRSDGDDPVMF